MPNEVPSRRAKFRRERKEAPRGFVRYRTKPEGSHLVVIGVLPSGATEVQSILHPKGEVRVGRPARGRRKESHPHGRGHHGGPCDGACRAGRRMHAHRR